VITLTSLDLNLNLKPIPKSWKLAQAVLMRAMRTLMIAAAMRVVLTSVAVVMMMTVMKV
jgi:hypothetical protein